MMALLRIRFDHASDVGFLLYKYLLHVITVLYFTRKPLRRNENPAWQSGKPLEPENAAHPLSSWEPFRSLRSIHLRRQKKQRHAAF